MTALRQFESLGSQFTEPTCQGDDEFTEGRHTRKRLAPVGCLFV